MRKRTSSIVSDSQLLISKLSLYPAVLIFCWLGASVNRIQNAIDPENPQIGLYIWEYLFNTQQGFLNACVFGYALYRAPEHSMVSQKQLDDLEPLLEERISEWEHDD